MTKSEELTLTKSYPTELASAMQNAEMRSGQVTQTRKAVAKTKRRIEISVEKHRLIVLSRRTHSVNAWCRTCAEQTRLLTPDEAATVAGVSSRTIYRRVEAGSVHYMEMPDGHLLVCANSIRERTQ